MRIAVIGGGVSGCLVARLLATRHEVTLFVADRHAGGHAHTVDVLIDGRSHAVDVGFMVFNRRTYPNFCRVLDLMGIASRPSDMSFSVRCSRTGFEYQGGSLRGLFAQRRNALDPSFIAMLRDILRFNRLASCATADGMLDDGQTVEAFLTRCGVGERFISHYLAPMAAAIWSSNPSRILDFPARFLIGFYANHGLLQIRDRPRWRTIVGGSRNYVAPLLSGLAGSVRLETPVESVRRLTYGVEVAPRGGCAETYDEVVFATHADHTLAMLADVSRAEHEVLAALPYQTNRAVLHTDASLLPTRHDARASWNYRLSPDESAAATVTYDLTRLQRVRSTRPLLLTLNDPGVVDPAAVLREFSFAHPAYSVESIGAQRRWGEISGRRHTHYCGAYWGYGFHEDGVNSALAVAAHFGIELESCTAACMKAPSPTADAAR